MRMILMAGAAVVAGVFVHRVAYWDGWHKGVARGRELARLEAQNDLRWQEPTEVTAGQRQELAELLGVPARALFPHDNAWPDPRPGGEG